MRQFGAREPRGADTCAELEPDLIQRADLGQARGTMHGIAGRIRLSHHGHDEMDVLVAKQAEKLVVPP
jgi:hypothetical protein